MTLKPIPVVLGGIAFLVAIGITGGVLHPTSSSTALVLVGIVIVVAAVLMLSSRFHPRSTNRIHVPERTVQVEVPGSSLQEAISQFSDRRSSGPMISRRTVRGLRTAAVTVLNRFGGYSIAEATRRVADGTWTANDVAAGFLAQTDEEFPRGETLRGRIATGFGLQSSYRKRVCWAVGAIAAVGDEQRTDRLDSGDIPRYSESQSSDQNADRTRPTDSRLDSETNRDTGHWAGISSVALLTIGLGTVTESVAVLLAGVVLIGYAGFSQSLHAPSPTLSIDRQLSNSSPQPGTAIEVTVTITNRSRSFVPDLRFVDGVPVGLTVTAGSPRLGTALRPGESVTFTYTITATRGHHEFERATVVTRDPSRSSERVTTVEESTTLTVEPQFQPTNESLPLRPTATSIAGRLTSTERGAGTEFHSVREYRPTDPLSRIDWKRTARTGELATVEFHDVRATRVVILIDARNAAYLAPDSETPHAVDRAVEAAGRIGVTLLDNGDAVGVAGLGAIDRVRSNRAESQVSTPTPTTESDGGRIEDSTTRVGKSSAIDGSCWLTPSSGRTHRLQFQRLLAIHPQFSTIPPKTDVGWVGQFRTIQRRLSPGTQVVFVTPQCDSNAEIVARQLEEHRHPVTIVSPDPTADRTAGHVLARVARRVRIADLRRSGIPVIDWGPDDSIDLALARASVSRGGRSSGGRSAGRCETGISGNQSPSTDDPFSRDEQGGRS